MTFGILASAHVPFAVGSTYADEVLADSPYAYYRLGESSGTTMTDSSGNSRNGTYVNSPTLGSTGAITSDSDTAVFFPGTSDQHATCPNITSWLTGQTAFSFECWFKTSTTLNRAIMGYLNTGVAQAVHVKLNRNAADSADDAGEVNFYVRDLNANVYGSSTTGGTWNDGAYHHLVVTYDSAATPKTHIYVDGVDRTISTNTGGDGNPDNFVDAGYTLTVGARNNRGTLIEYMAGVIDEVAFYRGALPEARILAHYNAA